jgi:hypothetical protein
LNYKKINLKIMFNPDDPSSVGGKQGKLEETAEPISDSIAEAMKAGDYDKVAELAQKAKDLEDAKQEQEGENVLEDKKKSLNEALAAGRYEEVSALAQEIKGLEGEKTGETKEEKTAEKVETKNEETVEKVEVAEDKKVEDYMERNKEQIKGSAESWLKAKEEKFSKRNEWMLMSSLVAGSLAGAGEMALWAINNGMDKLTNMFDPSLGNEAAVATAMVAVGGAIVGGIVGKFADYMKRRKQRNAN